MRIASGSPSFLDPLSILREADIIPGSVVADFGCGSGYFTIPCARIVGRDGHVYALDILPQALESVESQARMNGITNITTLRVNFEKSGGSTLNDLSADWFVMKDVLFLNKDKEVVLRESFRVLKPGGRGVMIEWNDEDSAMGPERALRMSSDKLRALIDKSGFIVERALDAGHYHYGLVIKKPGERHMPSARAVV